LLRINRFESLTAPNPDSKAKFFGRPVNDRGCAKFLNQINARVTRYHWAALATSTTNFSIFLNLNCGNEFGRPNLHRGLRVRRTPFASPVGQARRIAANIAKLPELLQKA
jgi:hypothetical protein